MPVAGTRPTLTFAVGRGAAVPIAQLTAEQFVSKVVSELEQGVGVTVTYLNFHTANVIHAEPGLARLFGQFDMVTPEGVLVIQTLRWLGHDVDRENILSAEFIIPPVFREATRRRWPVYLLGAEPGVAQRAAANLAQAFPGVDIVGTHHGHFDSPSDEQFVLSEFARLGVRILLVGMGQPRQEEWIIANGARLGGAVVIALGGYFDKVSKTAAAYPQWVYTYRAFWLYRLITEPTALWRRYVYGGPRFLLQTYRAQRQKTQEAG